MTNQVKAFIFDLGKVIVNFNHMTACKKLSFYSPFDDRQIYSKIFSSGLESDFDTGKIDENQFCEIIISELRLDLSIKKISEIWSSIFSLNSGIDKIILKLKNRYRLLCLSNTNPIHFNYCMNNFDILGEFESFILSYKVGIKKPAPAIYRKAIETSGLMAQECLYIDDIQENTDAACAIGMGAIRFISVSKLEKELSIAGFL